MLLTTSRARGLALLLCWGLAATTSSGCSFVFVDGPPTNARKMQAFTCTNSNALPVVDAVIAGLAALSVVGALTDGSHETYDASTQTYKQSPDYSTAAVAGAWAALFAASAFVGHSRVSECRDATDELMQRMSRGAPGPGFMPAPFAPGYAPPAPYDPWTAPPAGFAPLPPAPPPPAPPAPPGPPAPPAEAKP